MPVSRVSCRFHSVHRNSLSKSSIWKRCRIHPATSCLSRPQNNVWVLPTHNRPVQCRSVIERIKEMGCSTPGVVVVNGLESALSYETWKEELPENWQMVFMPENIGLCGAMRWFFSEYPNLPFYGVFTDDEFIETPEWDVKLIAEAGRWKLAHANNGDTSATWPHSFMTFGGE